MKQITSIILFCISFNSACFFRQDSEVSNNNQNLKATSVSTVEPKNSDVVGQTRIPPSADTLSVALTLLRQAKETPVKMSEVFAEKDGVRLNVSVVEKGFLLVLYKGSEGDTQVIFPNKNYFAGKNEVEPHKNVVIPNKGWFLFDEKKGTETIFVVYSKTQTPTGLTANPKQTLESFENERLEKNNADAFSTANGSLVRVVELKHQ